MVHPDLHIAEPTAAALRAAGHQVIVVDSGERAIDLFVQQPAHAMVVDLDLPGRDGAATIESIRWAPGGDRTRMVLTGTRAAAAEVHALARELAVTAVPSADIDTIVELLGVPHPAHETPPSALEGLTFDDDLDAPGGDPVPPIEDPRAIREGRDVERRAAALGEGARIEGDLDDATPFAAVLARLGEQRATGALVMTSAGDPRKTTTNESPKKVVFFRNGIPVHVRSNLVEECLGQLMLRAGLIDPHSLAESLARVRDGDGRQGGILVAMGAITPHQLREALEAQQREKLFDIFAWPAGSFAFTEDMAPPRETVTLEMALAEMVHRGIRERVPGPRVVTALEPYLARYATAGDRRFRGLLAVVNEEERGLLRSIDGRRTVRALLDGYPRRAEAARVLWAARCLGVLGLREDPAPSSWDGSDELESDARSELARVVPLLREGRYAEALGVTSSDERAIRAAATSLRDAFRALATSDAAGKALRTLATETIVRLTRAESLLTGDSGPPTLPPPAQSAADRPATREIRLKDSDEATSEKRAPGVRDSVTRELPADALPADALPADELAGSIPADAIPAGAVAPQDHATTKEHDAPIPQGARRPELVPPSDEEPVSVAVVSDEPSYTAVLDVPIVEDEPESLPGVDSIDEDETTFISSDEDSTEEEVPEDTTRDVGDEPTDTHVSPASAPSLESSLYSLSASLELPHDPDLDDRVERMLRAERHFRRGCRALQRGDLPKAHQAFRRAVRRVPDEGEFVVHLGWVEFQLALDDAARRAALQTLERGCALIPKRDRGHLFHARALRELGDLPAARNAYTRALSANPDCAEALEELRALT